MLYQADHFRLFNADRQAKEHLSNIMFKLFGMTWQRIELPGKWQLSNDRGTRRSVLTMTNPNHLCDVLLFVCSKMADETNLRSKLPVADRTREV